MPMAPEPPSPHATHGPATPHVPPDELTVLCAAEPGRIATKRFTRRPDGSIAQAPYGHVTHWRVRYAPVTDLATLLGLLRALAPLPSCCVTRAAPRDGVDHDRARRTPATFREAPRAWAAFDFDGAKAPAGLDPLDPTAAGLHLRDLLPEAFRDAACVVQATSSCGVKPELRYRLWFLLGRPLLGAEIEAWVGRPDGLDPSTLRPTGLIYTATPLFEGMPDPVRERFTPLAGLEERVLVPDAPPAPAAPSLRPPDGTGHGDPSAAAPPAPHGLRGTPEAVRAAMAFLPNDDLPWDEWIRKGFALKGALGEEGWPIFDAWSQTSGKYDVRTTARAWRGLKAPRIGIGHLVWEARRNGWAPGSDIVFDAETAAMRANPELHPAAPWLRILEAVQRLNEGGGLDFQGWLALVGDGEGLLSFPEPIGQAVAALCRVHGPEYLRREARGVKAMARAAIARAPKRPDRGAELDRYRSDAWLDKLIADTVARSGATGRPLPHARPRAAAMSPPPAAEEWVSGNGLSAEEGAEALAFLERLARSMAEAAAEPEPDVGGGPCVDPGTAAEHQAAGDADAEQAEAVAESFHERRRREKAAPIPTGEPHPTAEERVPLARAEERLQAAARGFFAHVAAGNAATLALARELDARGSGDPGDGGGEDAELEDGFLSEDELFLEDAGEEDRDEARRAKAKRSRERANRVAELRHEVRAVAAKLARGEDREGFDEGRRAMAAAIDAHPQGACVLPRVDVLLVDVGVGKTEAALRAAVDFLRRDPRARLLVVAPYLMLCDQIAARLRRLAAAAGGLAGGTAVAAVWRGFEQELDGMPMCARADEARVWTTARQPLRALCAHCPLAATCRHYAQDAMRPRVWVTSAAMAVSQADRLPVQTAGARAGRARFDAVILDEAPWSGMIDGFLSEARPDAPPKPICDAELIGGGITALVNERKRIVEELNPLVDGNLAGGLTIGTPQGADLVLALQAILNQRAEGRAAAEAALAWADFAAVGYADRAALTAGADDQLRWLRAIRVELDAEQSERLAAALALAKENGDQSVMRAVRRLGSYRSRWERWERLLRALRGFLASGQAACPHTIEVGRFANGPMGKVAAFVVRWLSEVHEAIAEGAVLVADAHALEHVTRRFLPTAAVAEEVRVREAPGAVWRVQVHGALAGKGRWDDPDGKTLRQARMLVAAVGFACGSVVAIGFQQFEAELGADGAATLHFGALAGQDQHRAVGAQVIVGCPYPAAVDLARTASLLTGAHVPATVRPDGQLAWLEQKPIPREGRDGLAHRMHAPIHPDPMGEQVREMIADQLTQADGRGRPCRRTAERPLLSIHLSSQVVKAPVDRWLPFERALDVPLLLALAARGVVPKASRDIAAVLRLWEPALSESAVESRRARGPLGAELAHLFKGDPEPTSEQGAFPAWALQRARARIRSGFWRCRYRRDGSRQGAEAWVDPTALVGKGYPCPERVPGTPIKEEYSFNSDDGNSSSAVGALSPAAAWRAAAAAFLTERLGEPVAVLELAPTGGAFPDLRPEPVATDEPPAHETPVPAPTRIERAA
jgi:hypothetical protein